MMLFVAKQVSEHSFAGPGKKRQRSPIEPKITIDFPSFAGLRERWKNPNLTARMVGVGQRTVFDEKGEPMETNCKSRPCN